MALIDIVTNYYDESKLPQPPQNPVIYPDEWRMKIQNQPVGATSNYDLSSGCYYGLGAESAMSNISYMDVRKMFNDKQADPNMSGTTHFTTSYGVSDFTFSIGRLTPDATNTNDTGRNAFIGNAPKKGTVYNVVPYNQRVYPSPNNKEVSKYYKVYENFSLNWTPISRFMFRDVIATIYVDATDNLSEHNSTTYTLENYLANQTSAKPYITGVWLKLFINLPNSYTMDTEDPENPELVWNKRFIAFPEGDPSDWNNPIPWNLVYGERGSLIPNPRCAITHLQSTNIEYNATNWAFNVNTLGNGNAYFKILGGLQSPSTNHTSVRVLGQSGEIHNEGEAYIPFALLDTWNIQATLLPTNQTNKHSLSYRAYRNYDDTFEEECMQQAACFCLFFMKRVPNGNQDLEDLDVYLGIPENGVGHGKYTNDPNKKKTSFQWDGRSDGTSYKSGSGGGASGTPSVSQHDKTRWNTGFNFSDPFHQVYVLSSGDLEIIANSLFEWINNSAVVPPTGIVTEVLDLVDAAIAAFGTNNPLDTIVSLRRFPFNIPHTGNPHLVHLGLYNVGGSGPAPTNLIYTFDQTVDFPTYFGTNKASFLDYEPYTKAELLIPYCGMVSIPTQKFVNKTITVRYVCDLMTGQLTAYVMADDVVYTSIKSTCAFEIPVTGIDMATLTANYTNSNLSAQSAALTTSASIIAGLMKNATSIASKGIVGSAIGAVSDVGETLYNNYIPNAKASYDINHVDVPYSSVGNASSICAGYSTQTAALYIYKTELLTENLEDFRRVNGFACCDSGTLNSLSTSDDSPAYKAEGYVEVSEINLDNLNATATVKNMIKSMLANGIYI